MIIAVVRIVPSKACRTVSVHPVLQSETVRGSDRSLVALRRLSTVRSSSAEEFGLRWRAVKTRGPGREDADSPRMILSCRASVRAAATVAASCPEPVSAVAWVAEAQPTGTPATPQASSARPEHIRCLSMISALQPSRVKWIPPSIDLKVGHKDHSVGRRVSLQGSVNRYPRGCPGRPHVAARGLESACSVQAPLECHEPHGGEGRSGSLRGARSAAALRPVLDIQSDRCRPQGDQ